ncbi:hypothetical protein KW796_00400 [Candidatus Parcubacteria bacterium]|nr:hypothetical protein [Candidatus Parcubacteria bacterium]
MDANEVLPAIFEEFTDTEYRGKRLWKGHMKEFMQFSVHLVHETRERMYGHPDDNYRFYVLDVDKNDILEIEAGKIGVEDGQIARAAVYLPKCQMDRGLDPTVIVLDTDESPFGVGSPQALAAAKVLLRFCELSQSVRWGHIGTPQPTA